MSVGAPGLLAQEERAEHLFDTGVARSPWQLFWRRLRSDRLALAALVVIALLVLAALLAPLIAKLAGVPGPTVRDDNAVDMFGTPLGPSGDHPFGVDPLGRDVLARTVYGARVSLLVGIVGTTIAVLVGVTAGLLAGYYRGWVDTVLSRFVDVVLSFPVLLLGIGIASACSLGEGCIDGAVSPGLRTVILVVALVSWTSIARIVRGQVLSLREREFVTASRSLGASNRRILTREILPNLVAPVVIYSSLLLPQTILLEAALSFLGVGVSPPTASWGWMIADAAENFDTQWWYMLFPGAALVLTVLAFNVLGDGLRDALDPRSER
ncbi:MAG TPA: ABC transporter permease [Conexibacter sp.]|nr:ABC transporter permease [Conexibacter sp.]